MIKQWFDSEYERRDFWKSQRKLCCPKLRGGRGAWFSLKEEPCIKGDCGLRGCHNYQSKYDPLDKLLIVLKVKND